MLRILLKSLSRFYDRKEGKQLMMNEHRKELFVKFIELKEEIEEEVVAKFNIYGGKKGEELEIEFKNSIQQYNKIPGPIVIGEGSSIETERKFGLLLGIDLARKKWKQYFSSIKFAISDLINFYSGAVASNKISENETEIECSYWKFNIRNSLIKEIIPYYFRILDYISFMINELSKESIINPGKTNRDLKGVDFKEMTKRFQEDKTKEILLKAKFSKEDISKLKEIFDDNNGLPFKDITNKEKQIIERFRNVITHRYYPGIDIPTLFHFPLMSKVRAKPLSPHEYLQEISIHFLIRYVDENLVSSENFDKLRKEYLDKLQKNNKEKSDNEKVILEFIDKLDKLAPIREGKKFKDYINEVSVSNSEPEFTFIELEKICKKLLSNIGNIMCKLVSLDYWKTLLRDINNM